ncbi:unnamed protein product [Brassicogethes aeneus]|uniref:DUF4773 domain-containing protein n=1 Tax=Brassicogethes aeneus TaxID=1431903 RepID=A0A9P0FNU3_BRAAE|nr:unnamed protein product [Brassicogethes aeneus]
MNNYFIYLLCGLLNVRNIDAFKQAPDTSSMSAYYYEPKSGLPFRITSIKNSLMNASPFNDQSSTKTRAILRRIDYRANGCTCHGLSCGCCLGFNFQQFNFNREGCMNFTYDPDDFSISLNMLMNENSVFSNTISAKNPPPLCIPLPLPYIPVSVEMCAKLFDIHTPGQNLHMCLDFETRFEHASLLVLHFDCMRMGMDGVALAKPGEVPPSQLSTTTTDSQLNPDIYDIVTEVNEVQITDDNVIYNKKN